MKSEKEIRKLLSKWKYLREELLEMGDPVSLIVVKHSNMYINMLEWVLEG